MRNWIKFRGRMSNDLGIRVLEYPAIPIPEERVQNEPIPGRSGSLTVLEGDGVFDDVVLSIPCYVDDLSQIDQIAAWLRGSGDLVIGNIPDRYYKARCANQIDLAILTQGFEGRSFAAVFRCSPFRYIYPEPPAVTLSAPGSINNPGTAPAIPKITIVGSGTIELRIGDRQITVYELPDDTELLIDCETGRAFDGATDYTSWVSFDYFPWEIPLGISEISWEAYGGTVTSVTVSRPWRYI